MYHLKNQWGICQSQFHRNEIRLKDVNLSAFLSLRNVGYSVKRVDLDLVFYKFNPINNQSTKTILPPFHKDDEVFQNMLSYILDQCNQI